MAAVLSISKLVRLVTRSVRYNSSDTLYKLVQVQAVESFVERCMTSVGTNPSHAKQLAQVLVAADNRGHFSHGLNRLEMYVDDIRKTTTANDGSPTILKEFAATAHVDGNKLLGPVVGNFCMDIAIKKAQEAGVGWVSCKGSNHYGIAGWYAMKASEKGFIGMSFTNTSSLVVPTRARKEALGTNPIALAAPGLNGDDFVLDMATSTCAVGKIEMCKRKNTEIARGWGVNSSGVETLDPSEVLGGGGLLPLGGTEISSGYKGYGLGFLVEILCGILGGATYGPHIRKWMEDDKVADLGQCFIAVNPECFAPGFQDRLSSLMSTCRSLEPAEGEIEVLVAGDPERKHIKKVQEEGGIQYHVNMLSSLDQLADRLKVEKMPTKQ